MATSYSDMPTSYMMDSAQVATEGDLSNDPASGSFFHSDYKKHDDLKIMLDGNKDGLKLEAMKRIIGMVAKGRDASSLFPAVVKNVVSKNLEVKKLVYVYLVRYAEEQQDLALLSISTFQRALKDPNQLIRASALRVLSSIRVPVIVPIMMLAIKDSVNDMSPYVRKTAAHAIPKLFSLDCEQREELIEVIEKLLSDKTTLVMGSAVMAFEEVCPERIDLIHKNYRKLCNLLVDVEEWGQVVIIGMLTRYARSQFVDPNKGLLEEEEEEKPFYDDEDEDSPEKKPKPQRPSMDPDHRLLLRNTKPLLQSRNAAVVMGVAQLYHHLAPRSEVHQVVKALIRLLRSHREVQFIVLNTIATMSTQRKGMFEPYLKSFFVRSSDPTHIKLLKLEILTNLASESNISLILREFQTYIGSLDKEFVAATIQAIGRCASNIKEVSETCLSGLVHLLSNRDESVVAESVVVIKKLIQADPSEHADIIAQLAKLVDNISVPAARASILWLLGEYNDKVSKIAPDVLRKCAKTFADEKDLVKLQILTLATKLYLTNPKQTELLCQYVFNLAKYDQSYDIRDRARFLRHFVFPAQDSKNGKIAKSAKKIFLSTKPAPVLHSGFKERDNFQLGSLSHFINARAVGYQDLPSFPDVAPDASVRNVEQPVRAKKPPPKPSRFYSSSETSSSSESSESSTETSSSEEESDSEEKSPSDTFQKKSSSSINKSTSSSSEDDSDESDSSEDSSEESSSEESPPPSQNLKPKPYKTKTQEQPTKKQSNVDLLLDLDDFCSPTTPVLTPSSQVLSPTPVNGSAPIAGNILPQSSVPEIQVASAAFVSHKKLELLNRVSGSGLQVEYRFTRAPHIFSAKMLSIELTFTNASTEEIRDIRLANKKSSFHEWSPISCLDAGAMSNVTLGVDTGDSTQPVNLEIGTSSRKLNATMVVPVGEMLRPVTVLPQTFKQKQEQLRGMNEHTASVTTSNTPTNITNKVYEVMNVRLISSDSPLRYAGQTLSSQSLVLITIATEELTTKITVNCEKMVIGSMILKAVKQIFI